MKLAIKVLGVGAALAGTAYAVTVLRRRMAIRRLEREAADAMEGDGTEVFFVPIVEEAVIIAGLSDVDPASR
jgi:hypothetical protein